MLEWKIIAALVGIATFFIGFGVSQMMFAIRMSRHIEANKTEITNIKKDLSEEKKRTDSRIFEVIDLVKELIKHQDTIIGQNQVFIAELKAMR